MDSGLKDAVVLITGAAGGIGSACARAFAAEGARLVLHAFTGLAAARRLAEQLPVQALALGADLTDEKQVDTLFGRALDALGRIDAVVANAGIWPREPAPIHRMELPRWNRVIAANQTSVFLCARAFFRHLAERRPDAASLVIIGSTAAVFGEEGHAEYSASKAAIVHGLTLSLKNEIVRLAPGGRVNAVCPGWTITPMAAEELQDAEGVRRVLQTRSLPRIARPEEIAAAVLFLSSPRLAGHVSGHILTVAGGMEGRLLHLPEAIDPASA